MSDLIVAWNSVADAWLGWLVERSVVVALASLVVGGVVFAVRRHVSAHLPSVLLLTPLLLLVVPAERVLPDLWPDALPRVSTVVSDLAPLDFTDVLANTGNTPTDTSRFAAADGVSTPPDATASPTPSGVAFAFAGWLLLLGSGVTRMVIRQRRGDRLLAATSRPFDRDEVQRVRNALGRSPRIRCRVTTCIGSPLSTGILAPTVYLPPGLATRLSAAQLGFVLRHEFAHVRRRDVLVEAAMLIAKLGWFFHPSVWLVHRAFGHWRELACDEAALAATTSPQRTPIADALLSLLDPPDDAPCPAGVRLLSTREFMKYRLTRILDRSVAPRTRLSAPASLALALTTFGALGVARAQDPVEITENVIGFDDVTNSPATVVLADGTRWLLSRQAQDGHWSIGADPRGNDQRDHNDVHATGLAIRALLNEVVDDADDTIPAAVQRGARWLVASQRADGSFGPDDADTRMYGHAQAILALTRVHEAWPDPQWLEALRAGVRFAESARNPYMGWRYRPRDGDNDAKITSLMLLALADARRVGVEVDPRTFTEARGLLEALTDPKTGRTGFLRRGEPMSRFTTKAKQFPAQFSEEPTAMKLLVDLSLDDNEWKVETIPLAIDVLAARPPEWDVARGTIDYAYWQFGAQALAHVGNAAAAKWRAALEQQLVPQAIQDANGAHWPAIDAWSHSGMEVYATASAMLALQALR